MRESAGSGFRLPPRAVFCKLASSFHLMQPSNPLLQAMRHSGHISAAFLPAPAGGPRRGVCEAWLHCPAPLEAEGSARLEAQAAVPRAQADAEWEKGGEASLAQPDVHPSELPLRESLSCTSPERRSHSRWARGFRGRLSMQRCLLGAVGQVGAVLSAPVAQPPPQILSKPPPPTPVGWLP